jgi:hypothetical protein
MRRLLVVVCIALVAAASAHASPPPTDMVGKWTRTVTQRDVRQAKSKLVKAGSVWTLTITQSQSTAKSPTVKKVFRGQIVPAAANLVNLELGADPCLYAYHRVGKTLIFTLRSDDNANRKAIVIGTWKRAT